MRKQDINIINENYKDEIVKIASSSNDEFVSNVLNSEDRNERVEKFGKNNLVLKKMNYFKEFFSSFIEPFNLLLLGIGIVNLLLYFFWEPNMEELIGFFLVFFMVILSTITDFIQEVKADKINKSLHIMVENMYNVVDNTSLDLQNFDLQKILSTKKMVEEYELTVGDVIYLSSGDVVPSDCRIIWSNNLSVDQSQLTGENILINKNNKYNECDNFSDIQNIIYSQSTVKTGSCLAAVVNVGEKNFVGMMTKFANDEEIKTDFDKGISKITKIILLIISIAFVCVMVASSLRTGSWVNGSILGITIIVALTPEALPAIISGNLQVGSRILKKNKVVAKNLNIIQNLGTVNVFATDKTGTLTSEKISLDSFHDINEKFNEEYFRLLLLNSTFQSSRNNVIDQAILKFASDKKIILEDNFSLISEEEFNHENRTVSVIVKNNLTDQLIQITKGSVDEMMKIISFIDDDGEIKKISQDDIDKIINSYTESGNQGKRTIILATKNVDSKNIENDNLIFKSYVVFDDVIKDGVVNAVNKIYENGIDIKILSGDSLNVTKNIAEKIGISSQDGVVGSQLNGDNNKDLIMNENIFTKLNPIQKADIVNCLHENDLVVSYLGDGVNDVLALKLSDVGISVNNGSSSAKKAADIIMLEKDLNVLNDAFKVGRKIFYNALKFIKLTIATNMGLMLSMLITSILFTFRAMIPIQLLIQNLLFDFSNLFFVLDNVDEISIRKPMKWNIKTFVPFIILIGIISMIISLINIYVSRYAGFINYNDDSQVQTIFFIESFITHMLIILICRTERVSFIKSNASILMYAGLILLFGILILFVYTPKVSNGFNLTPPKSIWWGWMFGLIFGTWCIIELEKICYKKIFKSWI